MTVESTSETHSTEADSGVGARRTVSNKETDAAFNRLNQDTGVDEAQQAAVLDQTRSWNANVKRTYDTLEEELHSSVKASQSYMEDLRTVRLQMLTNMTANADSLQKQHTAHRDIATDRTWTQINELEAVTAAKSGVQADAFVAALMAALKAK